MSFRCFVLLLILGSAGCVSPRTGGPLVRQGDEIVAAGQFFHTGTPVVLWLDPGGYDAYRVERHFAPPDTADWATTQKQVPAIGSPNRFGARYRALSTNEAARVYTNGWDLPTLKTVVDQFVLHYDAGGLSSRCFKTLHDERGLSVHFMLDIDGTIYQTLDLKERAWHATIANTRSVGIEIANIGAYPFGDRKRLDDWYKPDGKGGLNLAPPFPPDTTGVRTPHFEGHPARSAFVEGEVQGQKVLQGDFTPEQYRALARLMAALCRIFPKLECDYPRDAQGRLINHKLPDPDLAAYHGVLGHYHIQTDKIDPGPAFQWDRVVNDARDLLHLSPLQEKKELAAHP
jgi:N-acetyl-anhydromuramyl-L-alanine amidase AmpD